ncbi:hypothetical protein KA013_00880 [Patescibacteria group bacterium]|nr:hypothetical protein [Patescibacteria group bacterium]
MSSFTKLIPMWQWIKEHAFGPGVFFGVLGFIMLWMASEFERQKPRYEPTDMNDGMVLGLLLMAVGLILYLIGMIDD